MRQKLGIKVAAVCCVLLTVAACGGTARPSTEEISAAITGGESIMGSSGESLKKSAVECIAEALHDSDLSNETLQAFVKGKEDYEASEEEEDVLDSLESEIKNCVKKARQQ